MDSVARALKDTHTVFLVTNYWETVSRDIEFQQGKNVADAAKAAGISHLIFSSLINVTEASKGALPNVPHFDGKADIEKYIRTSGIPATFVMAGYFMSNLFSSLQKQEDGSYQMFLPISDAARFPLFDVVSDTGMSYLILANRTSMGCCLLFYIPTQPRRSTPSNTLSRQICHRCNP